MKTFFVKPAFWISLGTFVVCAVILIFIFNYRSEDKPDQTNNLKEDTTADSSVSGDKSAVTSSSYTATHWGKLVMPWRGCRPRYWKP